MSKEMLTSVEMKNILKEEGVVFHPQRSFQTPAVDEQRLIELVGSEAASHSQLDLELLYQYLEGSAVSDRFSDHDERRQWREKMFLEYGEVFNEVYKNNNQFRTNMIGLCRAALLDFIASLEDVGNSQMAERLQQVYLEFDYRLNGTDPETGTTTGPRYTQLTTAEERLSAVQFFEDKVLEALNILTGTNLKN